MNLPAVVAWQLDRGAESAAPPVPGSPVELVLRGIVWAAASYLVGQAVYRLAREIWERRR